MVGLRYCGWVVILVSAVAFWIVAEVGSSPKLVNAVELSSYTGGYDQWCVYPVDDTLHCNQCVSNGNGNYVKCDSIGDDKKPQYQTGQSPAQRWDFDETTCGGNALIYTNSYCAGSGVYCCSCGRTYTKATGPTTSYGVSCPPP